MFTLHSIAWFNYGINLSSKIYNLQNYNDLMYFLWQPEDKKIGPKSMYTIISHIIYTLFHFFSIFK